MLLAGFVAMAIMCVCICAHSACISSHRIPVQAFELLHIDGAYASNCTVIICDYYIFVASIAAIQRRLCNYCIIQMTTQLRSHSRLWIQPLMLYVDYKIAMEWVNRECAHEQRCNSMQLLLLHSHFPCCFCFVCFFFRFLLFCGLFLVCFSQFSHAVLSIQSFERLHHKPQSTGPHQQQQQLRKKHTENLSFVANVIFTKMYKTKTTIESIDMFWLLATK